MSDWDLVSARWMCSGRPRCSEMGGDALKQFVGAALGPRDGPGQQVVKRSGFVQFVDESLDLVQPALRVLGLGAGHAAHFAAGVFGGGVDRDGGLVGPVGYGQRHHVPQPPGRAWRGWPRRRRYSAWPGCRRSGPRWWCIRSLSISMAPSRGRSRRTFRRRTPLSAARQYARPDLQRTRGHQAAKDVGGRMVVGVHQPRESQ